MANRKRFDLRELEGSDLLDRSPGPHRLGCSRPWTLLSFRRGSRAREVSRIARVIRSPGGLQTEHDATSGDLYSQAGGPSRAGDPETAPPVTPFLGSEKGFTYRLTLTPIQGGPAQVLLRSPQAVTGRATLSESDPRIGAVVRREPLPGYVIEAEPLALSDRFETLEISRGPRFTAGVLDLGPDASADSAAPATRLGLVIAAVWVAEIGTGNGPAGGRLAVAVTRGREACDERSRHDRHVDARRPHPQQLLLSSCIAAAALLVFPFWLTALPSSARPPRGLSGLSGLADGAAEERPPGRRIGAILRRTALETNSQVCGQGKAFSRDRGPNRYRSSDWSWIKEQELRRDAVRCAPGAPVGGVDADLEAHEPRGQRRGHAMHDAPVGLTVAAGHERGALAACRT